MKNVIAGLLSIPALLAITSCGMQENSSSRVTSEARQSDDWKQLFQGKWKLVQSEFTCKIYKAIGLNVAFKPGVYEFNKGLTTWTGQTGYLLVDNKDAETANDTFCLDTPADIETTFQTKQEWLDPVQVNGENIYISKAEPVSKRTASHTYRTRFAALLHGTSCGILFPKLNFAYPIKGDQCFIERLFAGEDATTFDKNAFMYFAYTLNPGGLTFHNGRGATTPSEAIENLNDPKAVEIYSKISD